MVIMAESSSRKKPSKKPDRNTLKVYWYLLMQPDGKAGLRQIQRAMGYSSPNAALFHLNKLREMQLINHSHDGDYEVQQKIHYGEMKAFIQLRHYFIPKHAFYALTMTCIMSVYIALLIPIFSLPVLLALLPGILATGIFWFEAYLLWQQLPKFQSHET